MSLNVAYTPNISRGIDSSALKEVTREIFKRAESKSFDLSTLDLTKFKRAEVGVDLYSGKVDSATARQIAMANSGMQVSLNENVAASIKFLNSQASKSIFKNVEGKIAPAVNEETVKVKNNFELPKFNHLVKTSEMNKDKNGSNPFYKGQVLKLEKKENTEAMNIFA